MKKFILQRPLWVVPILIWTAVVAASLAWNWRSLERHAAAVAENRAHFVFKMVESVRLWNARHGGVYAVVDHDTLPNPYLEVPEREVETPSGRVLTLINPAYMTRQLSAVVEELSGNIVHITSLKPINPINEPVPWEREALQAFEQGAEDWTEFTGSGKDAVYRYMEPLLTEKACLKCHEQQGYEVGDIRGGISVAFSAGALMTPILQQRGNMVAVHAGVWLLLSGLTLFALSRFRAQMLSLQEAKSEQDALVEKRTRQLREQVDERHEAEAQLRLFIESSGEGIIGLDEQGRCTLVNPVALRLLGYDDAEAVVGQEFDRLIHHSDPDGTPHSPATCPLRAAQREGREVHDDRDLFVRADGRRIPVEYRSHPLFRDGRVIGAVVTFSDITTRKEREVELRKLSKAVQHSPVSVMITDAEGRIEYVNRRFMETTGYQSDEVIGGVATLLQVEGGSPETHPALWETVNAGRVWQGECQSERRNGETFWEQVSVAPIRNDAGGISHLVVTREDITERKALQERIWQQANFDSLTGLVNRHLFQDRLEHHIARARRSGRRFALLFVDLDGFKEINDRCGHESGDTLLRELARRLDGCVRAGDTVARMGGDEFTLILPDIRSKGDVEAVAGKVLDCLAAPVAIGAEEVAISGSVGIAVYPEDGENGSLLMRRADTAMYRAKNAGAGHYRFYGGWEL